MADMWQTINQSLTWITRITTTLKLFPISANSPQKLHNSAT